MIPCDVINLVQFFFEIDIRSFEHLPSATSTLGKISVNVEFFFIVGNNHVTPLVSGANADGLPDREAQGLRVRRVRAAGGRAGGDRQHGEEKQAGGCPFC